MTSIKPLVAFNGIRCLVVFSLLIVSVVVYAQDAGGVVNWNIEANTLDVKLPTDLPFVVNMTNVPNGTLLDRIAIYEIGEGPYPNIEALMSRSTKVYDGKIIGNTLVVPARLKFDTDYFLSLYELKSLSEVQATAFADSEEYKKTEEKIYKLIDVAVKKQNTDALEKIFNSTLHDVLGNLTYTYIKPKPSDNIYNVLSDLIQRINSGVEAKDILSQLRDEVASLMKSQIKRQNVLRATYSSSIESRVLDRIYMTFAFGMVHEDNAYLFTAIGFNYYFCGFNPRVPISKVKVNWYRRFSAQLSTTIMTPAFIDTNEASGILGGENINLGLGYMIADGVIINLGGQLFNRSNQNPLITESSLTMRPFLSLSFDSRLRTLNKI